MLFFDELEARIKEKEPNWSLLMALYMTIATNFAKTTLFFKK
jgi:hypothetical protein